MGLMLMVFGLITGESCFTITKIKKAVWECDGSKAPRPDGFNLKFIKTYWEIPKDDIVKCVRYFEASETNIILYGLSPDVYALVNHQEAAKDNWDRVKLLMKGTERECRLCHLFDKFAYVQGETLYEYYWRFSQLINDMHTIGMTMQQVQVNTKFLNALPPEWSNFVIDKKLAKSLYTTNYDQLYAYLSQHERHANEVRIMHERYPDPLAMG
ncbi:hypothetical protein Tco_1420450 [Tanacetum coccineum]